MKILLLILALGISTAMAQTPSITFNANVTTGNGSVTPVLTWSTTPAASECAASGDWAGSRAGSGTQTLPAITKSATYNLTCSWLGQSYITVRWVPPSVYTDGSALTDLAGYRIYYSRSSTMSSNTVEDIKDPGATEKKLGPLAAGIWYTVMSAYNRDGVESAKTPILSTTLSGTQSTANRTVGIVVSPLPLPPSNVTATITQ